MRNLQNVVKSIHLLKLLPGSFHDYSGLFYDYQRETNYEKERTVKLHNRDMSGKKCHSTFRQ